MARETEEEEKRVSADPWRDARGKQNVEWETQKESTLVEAGISTDGTMSKSEGNRTVQGESSLDWAQV